MPSDHRPPFLPRLAAIAALAALWLACPAGFVDPNPPVLQRVERLWSPPIENEPVVYALLFDLHLARGLDCAGTKARIAAQVRSLLITPGAPGLELPLVDISPTCRQAPDRHFDPGALDAAIQGAERTYGSRHVRALLVYVNDIDLLVPESLQSDFAGLRILIANRGAPLPVTWALTLGRGKDATLFQRMVDWRSSTDPGMFTALAALAGVELPMEAVASSPPGGVPLFTAQEAAGVVEYKACGSLDPRIIPAGFQFDGRARRLDLASPPSFSFTPPDAPPVMRGGFAITPVHFFLETCTASCDHFTRLNDGSVVLWDRTSGCTLSAEGGT
jgi:hypothetical protein